MTFYKVKAGENTFDAFGTMVPIIQNPTLKVKDWFYSKNIKSAVPSESWTYILAVVKETEKALQVITKAADEDGGLAGLMYWVPKSCTETIEDYKLAEQKKKRMNEYKRNERSSRRRSGDCAEEMLYGSGLGDPIDFVDN